jgi:hypothetical protein
MIVGSAYADENSRYIVVKGSTVQCPDWHNRILEVVEVKDNEYANLLGIPTVKIRPIESKAILDNLVSSIVQLHNYKPESLSVEILEPNIEYRVIINKFMISLNALVRGECPNQKTNQLERIEEDIEKIRKQDLSRHLSYNLDDNKAFRHAPYELNTNSFNTHKNLHRD